MGKKPLCNICFKNEAVSLGVCDSCGALDENIGILLNINPKRGVEYLTKKIKIAEKKSRNRYLNTSSKVEE
jgi:hypothetical protein